MTAVGNLSRVNPTDLDALREALTASDPGGKLNPIGMSRIEIGPGALDGQLSGNRCMSQLPQPARWKINRADAFERSTPKLIEPAVLALADNP